MKYLPSLFFAVLACVFAGLYFQKDNRDLGGEVALQPAEAPATPVPDRALAIKLSKLETQLDAREREVVRLKAQLAASASGSDYDDVLGSFAGAEDASAPDVQVDARSKTLGDQVAKVVKQSIGFGGEEAQALMREQMVAQSIDKVEWTYRDLFREFGLAPGDERRLKELLIEKGQAGIHFPGNESLRSKEDVEADIQSYLSDEGYARYQQYEKTTKARGSVSKVQRELADLDVPMTREQREALVEVFHATRGESKEVSPITFIGGEEVEGAISYSISLDGSATSLDAQLEQKLEARAGEYDRILEGATSVLDQEQLNALASHLDQEMQQKARQSKMTRAMVPNITVEGLGGDGTIISSSMQVIIGGSSTIQVDGDK
jgi:hypothetical protein